MQFEVTLGWPPRELSPNAKLHWAVKRRHTQRYREACYWQALCDGIKPNHHYAPPISIHLRFIPPDGRHRDEDNMIASCKAALDGLADALGVNDREFRLSHSVDRENIGGMVKATITCA